MTPDILRLVDSICRDKNIDKDQLLGDLEGAMASAIRKTYGQIEDVQVHIDRMNGQITAQCEGTSISMAELGRISAQTCKQVMIQKIREAERSSIFEEFSERVGTIITGTVARYEGGALVVNLGRTEGFLPKSEQIPGETHHPGDRVRAMILDVREAPHQVKIVLTRTHPDYIRRLFELEVPEVGERIIEIKALAREAGYRTKVAVASIDSKVDAVGACVGVRGSRIRNIVDELGGEKIDIVRWNESSQVLISNALKPAEVQEIALCFELGRCTVVVAEDQLSLAIGKRGQNVRLAARLTGWDIDILTPAEYNKNLDDIEKTLTAMGVEDVQIEKVMAMGMVSLMDVEEVGAEPLVNELEIDEERAKQIVEKAAAEARRLADEAKAKAAQEAAAKAAQEAEAKAAQEEAAAGEAESVEGAEAATGSVADGSEQQEGRPVADLVAGLDEQGIVDAPSVEAAEELEESEESEPLTESSDVASAEPNEKAEESRVAE
ncbi:MAG TPA: transcription termination factor NusA [Phycisphaerae bacterium]|nr:transcription termination factor NusA [Phycisphaerae bacterium]